MHPISKKRSLSINKMLPMLFVLSWLQKCSIDNNKTKDTSHGGTHGHEFLLTITRVYSGSLKQGREVLYISLALVLQPHLAATHYTIMQCSQVSHWLNELQQSHVLQTRLTARSCSLIREPQCSTDETAAPNCALLQPCTCLTQMPKWHLTCMTMKGHKGSGEATGLQ